MKEIRIAEADIAAVAAWIAEHSEYIFSDTRDEEKSLPPAIKVIRCVLSLRTSYDKVVKPRVETFMSAHPDIKRVNELSDFMASYPTPYKFMQQELINSEQKAKMLQQVVKFLCQITQKTPDISEEESLKRWAIQAKPQDCYSLDIKYFKVAGFQYLRMLFGADTTKPDKHIRDFIFDILNRKFSDIEAVLLLEEASKHVGLSVRDVDAYIWKLGARDSGTNVVHLDPDVAAAFPNEVAVNEALRSVLKERNKENNHVQNN